jgi:hypothetical protein
VEVQLQVKDWIERLKKELDPEESVCMHLWTRPDIEERAKEKGYNLSANDCDRLLDDMEIHIDSGLGVSWVTVEVYVDNYIRDNNLTKDSNFVENDNDE